MKKLILITATMLGMALLLPSCSEEEGVDIIDGQEEGITPPAQIPFTAEELQALDNMKEFNYSLLDVFNEISTEKEENMLVSPLSLQLFLGMIAEGADSELATDIAKTLGCSDINVVQSLNAKALSALPDLDPKSTARFANSVWFENGLVISPLFGRKVSDNYNAEFFECDLEHAHDAINRWCAQKTENKINRFLDGSEYLRFIALYNAMYFRGEFTRCFNKETRKMKFHGIKSETETDFMFKKEYVACNITPDFTSIEMPFGNGAFHVTLVLPERNADINTVIKNQASALAVGNSTKEMCQIVMPKFEMEGERIDLTKYLEHCKLQGVSDIRRFSFFDKPIDAETMLTYGQKSYVGFDEKGMTAAAVTGSTGDLAPQLTSVILNRPFLFYLIENQSGLCLLSGKVMNL